MTAELVCAATDPAWLERRREGITATDIVTIAGVDMEDVVGVRAGEQPIEAKARQAVEVRTYVMPVGTRGPGMGGIR